MSLKPRTRWMLQASRRHRRHLPRGVRSLRYRIFTFLVARNHRMDPKWTRDWLVREVCPSLIEWKEVKKAPDCRMEVSDADWKKWATEHNNDPWRDDYPVR